VEDKRRLGVLLALLAVIAAVAVYSNWPSAADSGGPARASAPRGGPATPQTTAPDVHSEALRAERVRPGMVERDLFRFKPKYVPPPPAPATARAPVQPPVPSGPPPVPPIGLKFIGVLEPASGGRIAILSDGRGAPIYGKEGEAVLGQYRILRIGAESIELEYIDGRGRQSIRLSGS
jgi:hypothetical protein